jgi:hypothetical protein
MQENPPAVAAAKPADILRASRRLRFGMVLPWVGRQQYRAGSVACQSKWRD